MKITDREALAAAEKLRSYCRNKRCPDCPFSNGGILKKAKNKACQHGNADRAVR